MSVFVLEIGTEELPARFLPGLEKELKDRLAAFLTESHVDFEAIDVQSTPRRAAATVKGISAIQNEAEEVVSGPPVRIAYDAEGKPTKAAEGFAKTQGVDLADAFTLKIDKGEYLAVRKKIGGARTLDLLSEGCPAIIGALPFPKKMKWGSLEYTYARPLRWVLAMFDDQVVPFGVADLASGNTTRGHRVHGPGPFTVSHADKFADVVREQCAVTLSGAERRAHTIAEGNALAAAMGGTVLWKDSLLDEVQGLSEHPVPCLGGFDPSFLELPREALLTSMQSHQKSFGLEDKDGNLLPYFLTVLNITPKDMDVVRKGWERVLRARLEDGRFFWRNDLKNSFDAWLGKLDSVIFLAPLGSMGNKTRRLSTLCGSLAASVDAGLKADAERAGRLSKADLVSEMVYEFDSLQGIMGGIYARKMGENDVVAQAIAEQYLPAGPDTPVPSSLCGALLSIADKADTMAGCFGLGMIPTGAADPYALRRCCLGITRIMLDRNIRVSARDIFLAAQAGYGDAIKWKLAPEEALEKMVEFFNLRLKNYFVSQGYETLLVEAALNAGSSDICDAAARLKALDAFSKSEGFGQAVLTFKRAANIIRKQGEEAGVALSGVVDAALFEDEAEKALGEALRAVEPRFESLWQAGDFDALFGLLGELRPTVDAFFDNVMVMCDDAAVRVNRLNLLTSLVQKLGRLADFAALQM
ncbi:glycine--tRNA ligase subunit beta [Desulfovibrio subterraneus]|uniref:Glycine--tRNA ligase beta subunit n=1 Tax=Desulfovibrio subterraneus TaxID=2718620 RepID=A0A7J0BJQ7_9BACT|nr:glycine--tRNA ligase subunit beta [Desulfovibrio subterraneus]GFM33977.1 glycine--tRNA ligase beta subunit [Desulfovibrio subterraneus]